MSESIAATFLFTDLVGSTELASRLSAAEAESLRQRHFSILRAAIDATAGREVKNLGDGLMVVFSSPSRAITCAVEMLQGIERHNRRGDTELRVRVGLSTGEASEEDGDFFGDPVIEAARLCARADGGQILATELLRMTVGRHSSQGFASLGELELKGLPGTVSAVEVLWEPAQEAGGEEDGGVPLPGRLAQYASGGLFGFSGRTSELAALEESQKSSAAEKRLEVALISGEPGVGKSCLAAHVARRAHDRGVSVLFGECAEGSHAPYLPWISALSQLVRSMSPAALGQVTPVDAWALRRLLPADASILPAAEAVDAEPETEQFLLMQSVVQVLEIATDRAPMILVLDDLQWADSSSLALLKHLIGSSARVGCLVVCTYRPSDLGAEHPLTALLADLHREPAVRRIDLGGLGDDDIIELIETLAGEELDDAGIALAHALRRETDGNPFFVAELLRHLWDSGAVTMDESGRFSLTSGPEQLALPQSVRDVVGQRVARLGPEPRRVLSTAAVIGREFDLDVLAAVADLDADAVLDMVETATTAALLVEADEANRYRFAHALIQQALYTDLSAARRQRTHLRVAEALEAEDRAVRHVDVMRLSELARHWQAATRPADVGKAIEYSRRAADAAMEALAPADAARLYGQTLELMEREAAPEPEDRIRLLLARGRAQSAGNMLEGLQTIKLAGTLAEATGDRDLVVACALTRLPNQTASDSADPDVVRLLQRALDLIDEDDHARRARLLAALVDETTPEDWRARRDLVEKALASAALAGDDAVTLDVNLATSFMACAEDAERQAANAPVTLRLAEHGRDPVALSSALGWFATSRMVLGDFEAARPAIERSGELARTYSMPIIENSAANFRSGLCMIDGDLAGVEQAADTMIEIGLQGFPQALASGAGALFQARWAQGRLPEYMGLFPQGGAGYAEYAGFRPTLVLCLLDAGDPERARALYDEDASTAFERVPRDMVWLCLQSVYVEATVAFGDQKSATALHRLLSPYAHLHAAAGLLYYGVVDRSLGRLASVLGHLEEAETRLRRGLDVHRGTSARYWTAVNEVDLAEVLLRAGKHDDEARRLLDEARRLAEGGGYGSVLRRLEALA